MTLLRPLNVSVRAVCEQSARASCPSVPPWTNHACVCSPGWVAIAAAGGEEAGREEAGGDQVYRADVLLLVSV
jgi:hypothetical protein